MAQVKVSVCVTTFNEKESTVRSLLAALNSQTLKPDEIIIIDAKDHNNCSRSKGRNISISKARNEIIAITDAGCIPHNAWLENITKPFKKGNIDVVAGGYRMVANNNFEKAESVFLGVNRKDMMGDFMPSTRSMALTKSVWKKAGGFPEKLENTAEDTLFNLELLKVGAKFKLSKNAIVDWYMPETLIEFAKKIKAYAKGDAESGIWWHPTKKLKTHNLKIMTVFLRYLLFLFVLFEFGTWYFVTFFVIYLIYAWYKSNWWGIILQFTSDFACIIGFSHGILQTSFKRN